MTKLGNRLMTSCRWFALFECFISSHLLIDRLIDCLLDLFFFIGLFIANESSSEYMIKY